MKEMVKSYSVWLDAIRGLAALVVFVGHVRVVFVGSIMNAVPAVGPAVAQTMNAAKAHAEEVVEITSYGHMAVIVFFVLSGYLVGGGAIRAVRSSRWSGSGYAIQRLSRLWTVLLPILVIGFVLDHLGMAMSGPGSLYSAPAGQRMVFDNLPEAMTFGNLMLNALFLQGIFGVPFGTNSPLWTLSYEFWFYAAFPFLLFALAPQSSTSRRLVCAAVLLAIGLFVGWQISFYFLFWLLGAGIEVMPKRLTLRQAKLLAPIGSALFVALLAVIMKAKHHIFISDAVESAAIAMLIYVIAHLQQERRRDITCLVAAGISAMSYTLYLAHAPINAFVSNVLMPVWRPWPVNLEGLFKFGLVTGLIFAICVALWWLFERNTPRVRRAMTEMLNSVVRTSAKT